MKANRIFVAWLVVVMVALGTTAWGFPGSSESEWQPLFGGALKRLVMDQVGRFLIFRSQLDIAPEQRQKIAAVLKKHKDEIIPVAKSVLQKRKALQEAVLKESGNENQIRAAAADLAKSIGDASVVASKVVADVRQVLTEKQISLITKYRMGRQEAVTDWLDQLAKK